MLRKFLSVVLAVTAIAVASCGRQVTPNRPGQGGGLQPGYMQVKIMTAGPIDLGSYYYGLIFNTSGTGGQPYAYFANSNQNWHNITFVLVIGGQSLGGITNPAGGTYQLYSLLTTGSATGQIKELYPQNPAQQLLYVTMNCDGQQNELCVTFSRSAMNCVFSSASPSSSPSSSPSASPSPSPTGSSVPSGGTCPPLTSNWYINWFTAQGGSSPGMTQGLGQVLDAPGQGGPNDQSWTPTTFTSIDTTQVLDVRWGAQAGWPTGMPPSAQLTGGEVLNNP